jgi:hypothetical protein
MSISRECGLGEISGSHSSEYKVIVYWDVATCSLVKICQTTQCIMLEDNHLE